jgi:hypothetical protein
MGGIFGVFGEGNLIGRAHGRAPQAPWAEIKPAPCDQVYFGLETTACGSDMPPSTPILFDGFINNIVPYPGFAGMRPRELRQRAIFDLYQMIAHTRFFCQRAISWRYGNGPQEN